MAVAVDAGPHAALSVRVVRELLRRGASMSVLATPAALEHVHPDALEYAAGAPPNARATAPPEAVVAVATLPTTRRKASLGVRDNPVSVALALSVPILPFDGDPVDAADRVEGALARGPLAGRRVLLDAGPASVPWDAIRAVASTASPALAGALRRELLRRGAIVLPPDAPERSDLAIVETNRPSLAPAPVPGKVASGREDVRLRLHARPPPARPPARRVWSLRSAHAGDEVEAEVASGARRVRSCGPPERVARELLDAAEAWR